jgi:hypothetical protein
MESENKNEPYPNTYMKVITDLAGNIFYMKCALVNGEERLVSIQIKR